MRRLTGVGSFLYQRFKRRTPHGKVGPNCPNCSTETGSTHTGSTSVGGRWPAVWSTQSACSCSTHQAHPCACPRGRGRKLVAIQTEARACQPRNCPFCHAAARRLHTVARDRDVPRPSSPRQMCARSCRVRACRLHRCPEGLLHPAVHLAFGCEMPKMTSDDGAAQPPTPGWERAARRLAAKARSRPTFPAIALSSSCTMA